ncbi:GAP family protein [Nocardia jejuensis]|uniref:GAP family protein n=1 Tax=Nocardia jejuensis TaxID=328049 RepID=UPI00082FDFF1|nr:GAP family protein [Nocardia jejuensis]
MVIFLLALAGFAFLDSLDVLLVGVTTAVIYDSRLSRRSPIPGALSFLTGVFAITTTFGLCTVLGLGYLTDLVDIDLTPAIRYRTELAAGLVLLILAGIRTAGGTRTTIPPWAWNARQRPWLLAGVGMAIGLAQAPTAVPYLAALTMLSARHPIPALWPLIIVAYCLIALLPPLLILIASTIRTPRWYGALVRAFRRFGPTSVRILLALFGIALLTDAVRHHTHLW